MHKQLEDYLSHIARNVGSLPQQRLDDELKEMREHLVSAIKANQEEGQSEDVAVANAIASFGTPSEVSAHVLQAWCRHVWKNGLKNFWGVQGYWLAVTACELLFMSPTAHDQRIWLIAWVFTLFIHFSLIIVLPYLRAKRKTRIKASE